jgi:2-isopropylmalate synthase
MDDAKRTGSGEARTPSASEIIYDWNSVEKFGPIIHNQFTVFDETLRDGIQCPSVRDPRIEDKVRILHLLDAIGVDHVNIGLPGAGPRAVEDATILAREIRDAKLRVKPACAARTHVKDIRPIIDISQKLGVPIEVMAFIGSSPIRLYAEGWDLDLMLKRSAEAIALAVSAGLPATYVTEDTTRARPEVLTPLFRNAIEHGASRLCLCDTVGHVTPDGTHNLIRFTRGLIAGMGVKVGIDWHGHNDRGLAVTNAIYSLEYGADRVHGTILGIGERVGNASLDQVLVNLKLLGELPGRDLSKLLELCRAVSQATQVPIPHNYPLAGADAFRTATGVHAAAIIKAQKKGDAFLADRIYSGVPAGLFGREQEIEIGPMSGESNVVFWLERRGIAAEPSLVKRILAAAKSGDHLLSEDEIGRLVLEHRQTTATAASLQAPHSDGGATE